MKYDDAELLGTGPMHGPLDASRAPKKEQGLDSELLKKLLAIDSLAAEMNDGVSPECSGYAERIFAILGWVGGHNEVG